MKRTFLKYFSLVLVLGLIIFAGCSKSDTDLQTTPQKNNSNYTLSSNNEEKPFVIPIIIKKEYYNDFFIEHFKELPSEMYFINSILAGYKNGEIYFNDEHEGKKFINNLTAISSSYTLSNKKNYNGISKKLEQLANNIPLTSNEITTGVINAIIRVTSEILNLQKETQFIAPDYLDTWQDVENFFYSAETQSIILVIAIIAAVALIVGNGCTNPNTSINNSCWNGHMSDLGWNKHGYTNEEDAYEGYKKCVAEKGGTVIYPIDH
ncbi:hypothetical protein J7L48_11740 [bacterium]|nr:hypothetical protein [bacterium]